MVVESEIVDDDPMFIFKSTDIPDFLTRNPQKIQLFAHIWMNMLARKLGVGCGIVHERDGEKLFIMCPWSTLDRPFIILRGYNFFKKIINNFNLLFF